jgi:hypothetical protein
LKLYASERKQNILELYNNKIERSIKWIFLAGAVILALIVIDNLIDSEISLPWKFAISTFILLFPFSLYLQASLNVNNIKWSNISQYQQKLRERFQVYYEINKNTSIKLDDIDDKKEEKYKELIEDRANFLLEKGDLELYTLYLKAYRNYREARDNLDNLDLKNDKEKENEKRRLDGYRERFLKFEIGSYLDEIVHIHMIESNIDFRTYIVPISFFIFMYLGGFLIIIPLINSIFVLQPTSIVIPLPINNETKSPIDGIPLAVVQWGFLGGLVYTSIDLLSRFLRKDITPRVYFVSSFRLIYSIAVSIVIYFIYLSFDFANVNKFYSPELLLIVFLSGIAPIQVLIYFADQLLSKIYKDWRHRNTVGNKPVIQLEGINSNTAGRLSEEGIDYIQQMAKCDPIDISFKTNYPLETINDWKDQALLYILTGDIVIDIKNATLFKELNKKGNVYFIDILQKKLGIRTLSSFMEMYENKISEEFITYYENVNVDDKSKNTDKNITSLLRMQFKNLYFQGKLIKNSEIICH